ncbi:ribonuclease H-like domain-containing protein [Tanacetum coccineum]|uniref:Ribonuclease H-like domain-containing protein n=1 Tax=Tanacetum coccineum TaxID=301880 RepID=A0ABQ4ZB20_9ASTR
MEISKKRFATAGEQSSPPAPRCQKEPGMRVGWDAIKSKVLEDMMNPKRCRGIQLEVHAAPVSREDINQKFLRSLPPSWSQIALIMRNKPDIDQTDIDDLYNNLRVYEDEMKRSSSSTSNSQNLAFLSSENTSSTNEVSTASGNFRVNTAGGTNSSSQVSSTPGADEVVCSFFAQQTTSPPLDNEDLQQIDQDDLEELDIRWQVAMLTVRVQRFIKKTGRNLDFKGKQPVTFDKSQVECYNCHRKGHFAKECKSGWNQGKRSYVNYALMAISSSSSSSSSDNEVQNCSKQCLESFKTLQKNFDSEREKHSRARLEIQGYELALESLESRILGHEKNELAWGEKYEFQNYELKCREIKINNLKMELEKVVKERDELKVKIEKWEESSKGLNKLLNSQMSAKDKNGLRSSDEENHTAMIGFPKQWVSCCLDEYAIRKKIIKSKTTKPKDDTSESKTSKTVGKTNEVEKSKPKINRDKVIIEDWNSDDEDDVSEVNTVSPVKTNETQTSTDHLIKDCDFYAKKSPEPKLKTMVNTGQRVVKPVWDNAKRVNHQKISNKLKYPQTRRTFVPKGVLTKTGLINPVRPNGKRAVHTVSTARPVGTARPFALKIAQTGSAIRPIYPRMDNVRPRDSYSPINRSYYTKLAFRPKNLKQNVKSFGVKNMTTAGIRAVVNTSNAIKKSRWVWKPKGNYMDHVSKESGSFMLKKFEYADLKGISKVKLLEAALKRKSMKVIFSELEDEETEDQGGKIQDIDDDPLVSLIKNSMEEKEAYFVTPKKVSASGEAQEEDISPTTLEAAKTLSKVASQNVSTYKRRARSASMDFLSAAKERLNSAKVEVNTKVNPGSARVNTGNTPVSTPSVIQTVNVIVPSPVKSQREGKAPMTSEDDEEDARQVHLDALLAKKIQEEQELSEQQQQKRKAEVQEAAQFYTEED